MVTSVPSPAARRLPLAGAYAAALLAALVVLPGCLGFLMLTHGLTATPAGAWFVYVGAIPLYALSALLLGVTCWLARRRGVRRLALLPPVFAFAAISTFGFFMHTGFLFRPVVRPEYVTLDEAINRFGHEESVVGVLDARGAPYAYVTRLARRPHIVQQPEGAAPFMMSHCILANSSMAYSLESGAATPRISISSVLANNLVYYDHGKNLTVQQIYNCSIGGRDQLSPLPTIHTTLAAWRALYPESRVWVRPKEWRDTFYLKLLARASVIDQSSPDLVYPLQRPADPRLPLKAHVMGVHAGQTTRAYRADQLSRARVTEDEIDGQPAVFLASEDGQFIQLYSRRHPGGDGALHFELTADRAGFRDRETGSRWDAAGRCTSGPLSGAQLTSIPHYNRIFWCVWADFFPQTSVHRPAA
jgi:hypothetical protein